MCSLILIEVFSFLQRARTEDSFYIEKLLKSDGFVNVEILSNTGELGIVSSRNNVDSFLPEKKNDIEMTDRKDVKKADDSPPKVPPSAVNLYF